MLGKRPRPNNFLRKTTSKSQLLGYGNSISKDSPQQVVVGFKLAIEASGRQNPNPNANPKCNLGCSPNPNSNSTPTPNTNTNPNPNPNPNPNSNQACESPKSVLDVCKAPLHSSSCRHSQRASLRSPRSVLGSLLISAGNPVPAGVGLGIVVAIKAEETAAAAAAEAEARKYMKHEASSSSSSKSNPVSIVIPGLKKSFNGGEEDEEADEEEDDDGAEGSPSCNGHGLSCCAGFHGSKLQRKMDVEGEERSRSNCPQPKIMAKDRKEGEGESEGFDLIRGETCSKGEDEDAGDMEWMKRESIFSAASPAASSNNLCCRDGHGSFHGSLAPHFLSFCCLCKRPLAQGRDIFMYRGDQGFCSAECRYQQIVLDDRKERTLASSSSSSSKPNCYAVHNHAPLPAAHAAAA